MLRKYLGVLAILVALFIGATGTVTPSMAQTNGEVPGTALGIKSDTDLWRFVRTGNAGSTQMKSELSAVMIQSEGDNWRAFRNGPLSVYGAYGLAGIIGLLVVFYMVRGRITIDAGPSEDRIMRFGTIDRFAHWLMAGSFVVLGITGLNLLYGRYVLLPIIGKDAFATITTFGKYAHNYLAFAFMLGLGLAFILWVRHNIPNKLDLKWLAMGGGIFAKGVHPPARKFNAGQKIIFWAVMIGGLSVSMSGIALMFPFQTSMFAETFALLNSIGFSLPTDFTPLQEQQMNQLWHGVVSLGLMTMIVAHIYIGSVGMEGALDAMNSGMVDRNWAKEHHNLWVEEEDQKTNPKPAE
ncbi:formate dehydrogenase subunit gamma [Alphaproteobacteria bacterium]|jgi:formate dehydrogenase subunit gamma|nr:formate dehydrogenase subunit gamma [Alphaproteobacteria bacterium]MDC6458168.1 formate dehydrogenase subunit gamma [Alphaproteobacteria bacterium]